MGKAVTVQERGGEVTVPSHPGQIATIVGLSEVVRLPRVGFLRLGKAMEGRQHPEKIDFFRADITDPVLAQDFLEKYGEEPRTVPIVFPHPDPRVIASQAYRLYKGLKSPDETRKRRGVLYCKGDGHHFTRRSTTDTWIPGDCPMPANCEYSKGQCRQSMYLLFVPYELKTWGTLQIATSSYNSIINTNSALAMLRSLQGHIDWIKLVLKLVPTNVDYPSEGGGRRMGLAYCLDFDIDQTLSDALAERPLNSGQKVDMETGLEAEEECPAEDIWTPEMQDIAAGVGTTTIPVDPSEDESEFDEILAKDDELQNLITESGHSYAKVQNLFLAVGSVAEMKKVLRAEIKKQAKKNRKPKDEEKGGTEGSAETNRKPSPELPAEPTGKTEGKKEPSGQVDLFD